MKEQLQTSRVDNVHVGVLASASADGTGPACPPHQTNCSSPCPCAPRNPPGGNCTPFCDPRSASDNAWTPGKPNVLLLGDSIAAAGTGYFLDVRSLLAPVATVSNPRACPQGGDFCGSSFGVASARGGCLDLAISGKKWDVIHLNWGLHDVGANSCCPNASEATSGYAPITEAEYVDHLEAMYVKLMPALTANGTLIFCTTTPVPASYKGRNDSSVITINRLARTVFGPGSKHPNVLVHDLYTEVVNRCVSQYPTKAKGYPLAGECPLQPNGVHFCIPNKCVPTGDQCLPPGCVASPGKEMTANFVVAAIRPHLPHSVAVAFKSTDDAATTSVSATSGRPKRLANPASASDDPASRLQADLDAAGSAGRSSFAISPGIYHFSSADLLVNGTTDLQIAPGGGGGVTLLFTCNFGLVLRSCTNVSIRDITIGYHIPCYSQGIVTAKTDHTITYTVDEGFPTPDSSPRFVESLIVKVISWEPATNLKLGLTKLNHTIGIQHVGGRSYEIGAGSEVGHIVTVGPRAGHTVLLTNCSECAVEGVTVHGTSDMALVEYGGGGANTWRRNRVVRNESQSPLGLLVSNADIFQSSGCERGPLVEDNEFTFAGDDCMNIHNYLSVAFKRDASDSKRVLLLDGVGEAALVGEGYAFHQDLNTFSRVKIGDVARIYDEHRLTLKLTTAVTAVEESTTEADLLFANSTLAAMGFHGGTRAWVGRVRCYWVSFAEEIPAGVLAPAGHRAPGVFVNIDRLSNGGAIVRRNTFEECGGLRFKSIGGSVSSNSFSRTVGISISIWPGWLEGSAGLRDVLVAENSMLAFNKNANTSGWIAVGEGTSNITVRDNHPAPGLA